MKPTILQRHTPRVRLAIATAIAEEFEDALLYGRSGELNERESDLPLTDLNSDGTLLVRLAAAFDGYDFEFAEENEPHYYRFYVHLLAAALSTLLVDGHDIDQAIEDAKAVLRERRDQEKMRLAETDGRTITGRILIPMFGSENFESL